MGHINVGTGDPDTMLSFPNVKTQLLCASACTHTATMRTNNFCAGPVGALTVSVGLQGCFLSNHQ